MSLSTHSEDEKEIKQEMTPKPGYRVRIAGNLSEDLVAWLDNEVTVQNLETGEALLFLPSTDQAALHGLLHRLYNLGLKLLALDCQPEEKQ